jgi:thymidylate kinase
MLPAGFPELVCGWHRGPVRIIAICGSSPGVGKSTLCETLAAQLTAAGQQVDHFVEEHVLSRPEFTEVAVAFTQTGIVAPGVLVDATVKYLTAAEAAGVDTVIFDALIPYVPSLLAFGFAESGINRIVDGLASRISFWPVLAVFLDGDATVALQRAAAREDPGWLDWYGDKLARYGLVEPAADVPALAAYLERERDVTLRVLRRQPWEVGVVTQAEAKSPAHVLATVLSWTTGHP